MLTGEEQKAVLKHFAEWSGGFTPAEMADEDHKTYAETARDASLDEGAVYHFLADHAQPAWVGRTLPYPPEKLPNEDTEA